MIFLLCFFFRQKTSYDMRISDWSSDVCSSDLSALAAHRQGGARTGVDAQGDGGDGAGPSCGDEAGAPRHDRKAVEGDIGGWLPRQIGRASCRERGCQYV